MMNIFYAGLFKQKAPTGAFLSLLGRAARFFVVLLGISFTAGLWAASASFAQDAVERHALELLQPDATSKSQTQQAQEFQAQPLQTAPDSSGSIISAAPSDSENVVKLLDNKPPLRVGLVAEQGASYLQARIEPFRKYLQESLSRPIVVVAFNSMSSLMDAHIGHQVDYSIYPASVFSMAYAACGCLTPMVAPVSRQAPDGTYMLLLVRGDSGIQSLADLSGRSMALSSKNGAVPFYMAMNELKKAGFNPERDLGSLVGRDNPQDALALLDEGAVDAALVWSSTPYNQNIFTSEGAVSAYIDAAKDKKSSSDQPDFISIWHSPAIPAGPHVIHNEVSKQERVDLINALKNMDKDDPDAYDAIERRYDGGFRNVTLKDYEPLIEVATTR